MTYEERADHIATMIGTHLGIRGKSLDIKLRKAGRQLPRDIRRHGDNLVRSVQLQTSPKMARMVDEESVISSYNICEKFLSDIDLMDRRKAQAISFLSTNAMNMLVVAGLLVTVLVWRGYL